MFVMTNKEGQGESRRLMASSVLVDDLSNNRGIVDERRAPP